LIIDEDPAVRDEAAVYIHQVFLEIARELHIKPPTRPSLQPRDVNLNASQVDTGSTAEPAPKRQRTSTEWLPSTSSSTTPLDVVTTTLPAALVAGASITPEYRREDLSAIGKKFLQDLLRHRFGPKRNKGQPNHISGPDAQKLVDFYFSDVFGDGSRQRIYSLIDELSTEREAATCPVGSGVLAANLSRDSTLPSEFRNFFLCYSNWQQFKALNHTEAYPMMVMMLRTIRSYELYSSLQRLRTAVVGSEAGGLHAFLARQGFPRSHGVGFRTCFLQYICRELNIPTDQLNKILCSQFECMIEHLVKGFGEGILVLLPQRVLNPYVYSSTYGLPILTIYQPHAG
jgi:hypothetical protein